MHLLVSNGDFWQLEANFEEFWSVFAKVHLRMEHNNNPIRRQLRSWRAENEQELEKYREGLARFREDVLEARDESGSLDSINASYSSAVWDILNG